MVAFSSKHTEKESPETCFFLCLFCINQTPCNGHWWNVHQNPNFSHSRWVPESLFGSRRHQFSPCEFWILSWIMAQLHPLAWVAYMEVRDVGLIPPRSTQKLKLGFLHPGCLSPSHVYDDAYLFLLFQRLRNALFLSKEPLQPIIQNFLTSILFWNPEKWGFAQTNL